MNFGGKDWEIRSQSESLGAQINVTLGSMGVHFFPKAFGGLWPFLSHGSPHLLLTQQVRDFIEVTGTLAASYVPLPLERFL